MASGEYIPFFESAEMADLVRRYEDMVRHNRADYFDEEEFELIIDHYLLFDKSGEALQAADCGSRQHPFSTEMKLCYAYTLIRKGEAQQALQQLRQMEAEAMSDPELFFLTGTAYLHLKNTDTAIAYFDRCLVQADEDERVSLLMNTATELMEHNEYLCALPYIQKALEADPDDIEIVNEMAFCYERSGHLDESLVFYEQYVKQDPFSDNVWYNIGTVHARKNDYEQALQAFHFAITLNDRHASAYYNLATTFIQQEKYTEAIEAFHTFLQLEPDNSVGYVAMAECYEKLEQHAEAIHAFRQAIVFDESLAEAHYGLAVAYANADRLDDALPYAYRAILLEPQCADYWTGLGTLLLYKLENNKRRRLK